jgi:hypothetical protein
MLIIITPDYCTTYGRLEAYLVQFCDKSPSDLISYDIGMGFSYNDELIGGYGIVPCFLTLIENEDTRNLAMLVTRPEFTAHNLKKIKGIDKKAKVLKTLKEIHVNSFSNWNIENLTLEMSDFPKGREQKWEVLPTGIKIKSNEDLTIYRSPTRFYSHLAVWDYYIYFGNKYYEVTAKNSL